MIFGHNSVGSPLSDLAANLDFGPSIVSNYPSPTVRTVDIACDDIVTVHGVDSRDAYHFAPFCSVRLISQIKFLLSVIIFAMLSDSLFLAVSILAVVD